MQKHFIEFLKDFTGYDFEISKNKRKKNAVYLKIKPYQEKAKFTALQRLKPERIEMNGLSEIYIEFNIERIELYIKNKREYQKKRR